MSGVAAYPEPADYVFDEERCLELASDTEQARAVQFEDFGRCSHPPIQRGISADLSGSVRHVYGVTYWRARGCCGGRCGKARLGMCQLT